MMDMLKSLLLFGVVFLSANAFSSSSNWRNLDAFAAIKQDGTVKAWGLASAGAVVPTDLANVHMIFSTEKAFTALLYDTTLRCWGNPLYGADCARATFGVSGVITVYASSRAFAALKSNGDVVGWGDEAYGAVVPTGLTNVMTITSAAKAFAAILNDGSVRVWVSKKTCAGRAIWTGSGTC